MAKKFTFIAGADDFLVTRLGREAFQKMTGGSDDDFASEIIEGTANNVADVEKTITLFTQAVNTVSMFGGKKSVWLKDANFLADSVTGRAEGTLNELERLKATLEGIDPSQVAVLFTAAPVDRRRAFYKWCNEAGDSTWLAAPGDRGSGTDLAQLAQQEAQRQGISIQPRAVELLVGKLNGNTRVLVEEIEKLAVYLGSGGGEVDEKLITELVPNFGEGDFFEAADAFFSLDLKWTLDALRRHFFGGNVARPLISTLQGRNRLLIQLRVLIDAGEIDVGYRGVEKSSLERAAALHRNAFGEKPEKNAFNVFTQHPYYLGRLAGELKNLTLKRLIDFQQEFIRAFEETISRPDEQEDVMREMAIRCLSQN